MNTSIMILIILLINCCTCLFGQQVLYKHQLRGLHKKELTQMMEQTFSKTYYYIYDNIIEKAKQGSHEFQFTIMCSPLDNANCLSRNDYNLVKLKQTIRNNFINGHQEWIQRNPNNVLSITGITLDDYMTELLDILIETFPDSNITKSYKNCCDYHTIKW